MFSQFFDRVGLNKLTKRQRHMLGGAWVLAALMMVGFLVSLRWSDADVAEARAMYSATLEVEAAVGYVRRRGGAINEDQAGELRAYYERALALAAPVSDRVLTRIHPELPKVWRENFLRSATQYVDATRVFDRDAAREASLIQDDWFRWYAMHKAELNLPDGAKRAVTKNASE